MTPPTDVEPPTFRARFVVMTRVVALLIVMAVAANAATPTATTPPALYAATFADGNLLPIGDLLNTSLDRLLRQNANVDLNGTSALHRVVPPGEILSDLPTDVDAYFISATLLRESSRGGADAALRLYDLSTQQMVHLERFRATMTDGATHLELALDAALARILDPHRGVIWIMANEPPESVEVAVMDNRGIARTLNAANVMGHPQPTNHGIEQYSRGLLQGTYQVTARFGGLAPITRVAQVTAQQRAFIRLNTGRSPETAGSVAQLAFQEVSPNQTVLVSHEAFRAMFHRLETGEYVAEWVNGVEPFQVLPDDEPRMIRLPAGTVTAQSWRTERRFAGKTVFTGVGTEQTVELKGDVQTVSLRLEPIQGEETRLNLVWDRLAAPDGTAVYVDDALIGWTFGAAEAHLIGLSEGVHRVELRGVGVSATRVITIVNGRETTAFFHSATASASP